MTDPRTKRGLGPRPPRSGALVSRSHWMALPNVLVWKVDRGGGHRLAWINLARNECAKTSQAVGVVCFYNRAWRHPGGSREQSTGCKYSADRELFMLLRRHHGG